VAVAEEEMKEWEEELKRLQGLLPLEADRNKLRDGEIPALDQQIREVEETLPGLAKTAELVCFYYFLRHYSISDGRYNRRKKLLEQ
jgi:hypothetical protein